MGQQEGMAYEVSGEILEKCRHVMEADGRDSELIQPCTQQPFSQLHEIRADFHTEWSIGFELRRQRINIPQGDGVDHVSDSDALERRVKAQTAKQIGDGAPRQWLEKWLKSDQQSAWKKGFDHEQITLYHLRPVAYVETCDTCQGHGNVECGGCNGAGATTCPTCHGLTPYSVSCKECFGSLGHYEHRGYNEWNQSIREWVPCGKCHGVGTHTCETCSGTSETLCSHCKGTGTDECPICGGTGMYGEWVQVSVKAKAGTTRWIWQQGKKAITDSLSRTFKEGIWNAQEIYDEAQMVSAVLPTTDGDPTSVVFNHKGRFDVVETNVDVRKSERAKPTTYTFFNTRTRSVGEPPSFMQEVMADILGEAKTVHDLGVAWDRSNQKYSLQKFGQSKIIQEAVIPRVLADLSSRGAENAAMWLRTQTQSGLTEDDAQCITHAIRKLGLRLAKRRSWWAWLGVGVVLVPAMYHMQQKVFANPHWTLQTELTQLYHFVWMALPLFIAAYVVSKTVCVVRNIRRVGLDYAEGVQAGESLPGFLLIAALTVASAIALAHGG